MLAFRTRHIPISLIGVIEQHLNPAANLPTAAVVLRQHRRRGIMEPRIDVIGLQELDRLICVAATETDSPFFNLVMTSLPRVGWPRTFKLFSRAVATSEAPSRLVIIAAPQTRMNIGH